MDWAGKFWANVDSSGGPDACWPWRLSCNSHGYGQWRYRGRKVKAHRMALEFASGQAPAGSVLHSRDNRPCCNPAHLRDGTALDNVRDMWSRGRVVVTRGAALKITKLTPDDVRDIRAFRAAGVQGVVLARLYGVTKSTVTEVCQGRRCWAYVA